MKFIFDNEEQKDTFMKAFSEKFDECPGLLGLNELSMSTGECTPETNKNCRKCWEQSGLEMEVIDEKVRKNEVYIIDIPADGSYVEILGHKIYGKWKGKDGEDSFNNFLDYLHWLKKCEERCERLKKVIKNTGSIHNLAQGYVDGYLTPNDIRWLNDLIDIPNHMSCRCSINMGGKPYSLGTAVGKGETNTKVELMSREKWLAERIIALLEVIKFNVDHSIIISDKWVDELNSVSYDFNECIKEKENE